jgi:hypothetical protein
MLSLSHKKMVHTLGEDVTSTYVDHENFAEAFHDANIQYSGPLYRLTQ